MVFFQVSKYIIVNIFQNDTTSLASFSVRRPAFPHVDGVISDAAHGPVRIVACRASVRV